MEKPHRITGTTFGYIPGSVRNQERKDELPKAIDLSHHLSDLAKNRRPSPLKTFYQYWRKPGVIGLAGGMELSSRVQIIINPDHVIVQASRQQNTSLSIRWRRIRYPLTCLLLLQRRH